MKAAYIEKFGGPEVLNTVTFPTRPPGRVRSSSTPWPPASTPPTGRSAPANTAQAEFPWSWGAISPAWSARSARASGPQVGDEVFGVLEAGRDGTYCEKIADRRRRRREEAGRLSHVDAAALALTGLTAICAVEES